MTAVPHVPMHVVKTTPENFEAINCGDKTFDVTLFDENMKVGDNVLFKEFSGGVYTQRTALKQITYIQHLANHICVIALNRPY